MFLLQQDFQFLKSVVRHLWGMESGQISNDSITVSSQSPFIPYDGYENARLHFKQGAWRPQRNDHNQWFQVDFGQKTQVTGISTQGHPLYAWPFWVKSYSLRYSNDGSYFTLYQSEQLTMVNHLTYFHLLSGYVMLLHTPNCNNVVISKSKNPNRN